MVGSIRNSQSIGLFTFQALTRLDPHIQLQLSIDAIYALMVPTEPTHVAQVQITQPKAPIAFCFCERQQPVRNQFVLIAQPRLIAIAISLMLNVRHALTMLSLRCCTAHKAVSLL